MNIRTPLTSRQEQILEWIEASIKDEGLPPSVREIAVAFNIKAPTVLEHLRILEEKNYIKRRPKTARGIEVLSDEPHHQQPPPSEKIKRRKMQSPFCPQELLQLDDFIIYCDQHGIFTGKKQLEYYDREGIIIPAVCVKRGFFVNNEVIAKEQEELTNRLNLELKYALGEIKSLPPYQHRTFSNSGKEWFPDAEREGQVIYPAQNKFHPWFERERRDDSFLRFYARNQCLALRTVQSMFTVTVQDPTLALKEDDWSKLGNRLRNNLPDLILRIQKTVLEHHRWMEFLYNITGIQEDMHNKVHQYINEEDESVGFPDEAQLTKIDELIDLKKTVLPNRIRGLLDKVGYSISDLVNLQQMLASACRDVDPNYQWPEYAERIPEALIQEARGRYRLARKYFILAGSVERVLRIIGENPKSTADLVAGSPERFCLGCRKRFRPQRRNQVTCGNSDCRRIYNTEYKKEQRKLGRFKY